MISIVNSQFTSKLFPRLSPKLVISGIKMMYHHYSSSKREEINKLRTQLFGDDYQLGNNRNEQM